MYASNIDVQGSFVQIDVQKFRLQNCICIDVLGCIHHINFLHSCCIGSLQTCSRHCRLPAYLVAVAVVSGRQCLEIGRRPRSKSMHARTMQLVAAAWWPVGRPAGRPEQQLASMQRPSSIHPSVAAPAPQLFFQAESFRASVRWGRRHILSKPYGSHAIVIHGWTREVEDSNSLRCH
jgi:hypothetical protein